MQDIIQWLRFLLSVFKAALKEAEFQRKEHIRKQGTNTNTDQKTLRA